MARIDGQLKRAAVETLGSDPSTSADKFTGRMRYNTATDLMKFADAAGTVKTFADTATAQTLTNKSFSDSTTYFVDDGDGTKKMQFQLSGVTTGNTRVLTVPDFDGTMATLAGTEAFSNKTFQDSTCFFVDNGDATKKMAFQLSGITTATTRTLTVPNFDGTIATLIGTELFQNKSFDGNNCLFVATLDNSKKLKLDVDGITSGNTRIITIPDATGTLVLGTLQQTLSNKLFSDSTVMFCDDGDNTKKLAFQVSGITTGTTRTLTAPDFNGTIATLAGTEAFSNKTFQDSTCFFVDDGDATKKLAFQLSGITTGTTRTITIPDSSGTIFYANTLTTKGDIFVATAASTIARQGIGGDGTVLIADSAQTNGLKWGTISAAPAFAFAAKSASYTLTTSDGTVTFDASGASRVATLPTAVGNTNQFTIIKIDTSTNTVTINTTSSQTINGRASADIVLAAYQDRITVQSDGANWVIISKVETKIQQSAAQVAISGATSDTYLAGGATLTLGAGKWRVRAVFSINCGSGTSPYIYSASSGIYSSDASAGAAGTALVSGANVKAVFGETTLDNFNTTFIYGGGSISVTNMRYFAGFIETVVVISGGTQAIYAVAKVGYSTSGTAAIGSNLRAERID